MFKKLNMSNISDKNKPKKQNEINCDSDAYLSDLD